MIIGVDIDGILADFNAAYIQLMIDSTGKDLFPPRPFDIPTWNYPEHFGYSDTEVKEAWKQIAESDDFWYKLKPYDDAEYFADTYPREDTYFITSRVGYDVKGQTEEWLIKLGVDSPTVLISSAKGDCCRALKVTHYIDDRTENCIDVRDNSPKTKCYMLARPWNEYVPGVPRLNNLYDFIEVLNYAEE